MTIALRANRCTSTTIHVSISQLVPFRERFLESIKLPQTFAGKLYCFGGYKCFANSYYCFAFGHFHILCLLCWRRIYNFADVVSFCIYIILQIHIIIFVMCNCLWYFPLITPIGLRVAWSSRVTFMTKMCYKNSETMENVRQAILSWNTVWADGVKIDSLAYIPHSLLYLFTYS